MATFGRYVSGSGGGGGTTGAAKFFQAVDLTEVGGTITPVAANGWGPHRYTALSDITLAGPADGDDGQELEVRILAFGGARTLTLAGNSTSTVIPSGAWWIGRLHYLAPESDWALVDEDIFFMTSSGGGSGTPITGLGISPLGISPLGG